MASQIESIFSEQVDPVMSDVFGQTIVRRITGSTANTEAITDAIVEKDLSVERDFRITVDSGFTANSKGQRTVRLARVDIPASYDVNEHDRYVIDNEVWDVIGLPVGEDSSRKTVLCRINQSQTGRQPRTQR